jgi:hypothetical protein
MPSPEIVHALLSIQTQETLSVPTAALILGALSQVDNLIELAERVCNPVFHRSTTMRDSSECCTGNQSTWVVCASVR